MSPIQQMFLGVGGAAEELQVVFMTAGTFSWTAPPGVTKVSVLCVGGGGGSSSTTWSSTDAGGGGGGGGLTYVQVEVLVLLVVHHPLSMFQL